MHIRTGTRIDIEAALAALAAFPQLQGRRVRLRAPRDADADALFALFADPQLMRYRSRPPMATRGEAEGLIGEILDGFSTGTALNWVVAARQDDVVIGTCALFRFDVRHRRAEIGYALHRDHRGRGLATEAASLALDWAFRALALDRIEAGIDPRNECSRRLLQRLGFSSEGRLRQRNDVGDQANATEPFGLLASAWRGRHYGDRTPRAFSAATAGSSLPSRNSRNAPPPVDM